MVMWIEHGDVRDRKVLGGAEGVDSEIAHRGLPGTEQDWGDVGDDLVDQSGSEEGRRHGGATLKEHVLSVEGSE